MKKIQVLFFLFFVLLFIIQYFFLIKTLKHLNSFMQFFSVFQKIEKITSFSCSFDENFADLTKNSKCAIFKIPSLNEKFFILKDFFDYVVILYHNDYLFFNLQPSNLSIRIPKSFYIKNIHNFNFKYLNNTLEFSALINNIYYSCDLSIDTQFIRLPFYDKRFF